MIPPLLPASFDAAVFLRDYWQKKPLLIRGTGAFRDPISPEELAGLACEEGVESRLVRSCAEGTQWSLSHGPFTEKALGKLPTSHWSLLVQAVDQWHEGVRAMLAAFRFIPQWRIDDIMISLAAEGGGVGPHFDYYDVFLIQGHGRKLWRLGGHADARSPLLPNTPLRLLQDFTTEEEWILEPGDILYIPPNIAHYGVSIGLSMTYSVGFRAPSVTEMVDALGQDLLHSLPEDSRFVDLTPQVPAHPGEIRPDTVAHVMSLLEKHLKDPATIMRSFGRLMTQPKYPELLEPESSRTAAQIKRRLQQGETLARHPGARFAYAGADAAVTLFADGQSFPCPPGLNALLDVLCDPLAEEPDWLAVLMADKSHASLIEALYNQGSLWFAEDDEETE